MNEPEYINSRPKDINDLIATISSLEQSESKPDVFVIYDYNWDISWKEALLSFGYNESMGFTNGMGMTIHIISKLSFGERINRDCLSVSGPVINIGN